MDRSPYRRSLAALFAAAGRTHAFYRLTDMKPLEAVHKCYHRWDPSYHLGVGMSAFAWEKR